MPYRLIPAAGEISSPKYATVGRAYRCDDLASVAHPARNSRPAARLASHRSGLGATRRQGRRSFRRLELRRATLDRKNADCASPGAGASHESVAGPRWPERGHAVGHCPPRDTSRGRGAQEDVDDLGQLVHRLADSGRVIEGDAALQWMRRACEWSKRVMLPNPPVPADLRASEVHNPATRRRNVLLIASPVEKIALTSRSPLSQKRLPVAAELCVRRC